MLQRCSAFDNWEERPFKNRKRSLSCSALTAASNQQPQRARDKVAVREWRNEFTAQALLAGRGGSVDVNTLPGAADTPACETGLLPPCSPSVVTGRARCK